LALVLGDT